MRKDLRGSTRERALPLYFPKLMQQKCQPPSDTYNIPCPNTHRCEKDRSIEGLNRVRIKILRKERFEWHLHWALHYFFTFF